MKEKKENINSEREIYAQLASKIYVTVNADPQFRTISNENMISQIW